MSFCLGPQSPCFCRIPFFASTCACHMAWLFWVSLLHIFPSLFLFALCSADSSSTSKGFPLGVMIFTVSMIIDHRLIDTPSPPGLRTETSRRPGHIRGVQPPPYVRDLADVDIRPAWEPAGLCGVARRCQTLGACARLLRRSSARSSPRWLRRSKQATNAQRQMTEMIRQGSRSWPVPSRGGTLHHRGMAAAGSTTTGAEAKTWPGAARA